MVEETVETENTTCNEESKTNDIDAIAKQDVAMQTNEIESRNNTNTEMKQQLIDLKSQLEKANQCIESLQKQMFTVDKFSGDDSSIKFFAGLPNWDTFDAVFKYLKTGNEVQDISYWVSKLNLNASEAVYEGENKELIRKRGRSRSLRLRTFLQLCADGGKDLLKNIWHIFFEFQYQQYVGFLSRGSILCIQNLVK